MVQPVQLAEKKEIKKGYYHILLKE